MNQARHQKQLRERARREKADAKRQRREARQTSAASDGQPQRLVSEHEVLALLTALHDSFGDGRLDFDEFERRKIELMAQLDG